MLYVRFRHIDTAQVYENEDAVGEGIQMSDVPRDDAVARDHRAGAIRDRIDVIRDLAVVRGYCRKAIARCCQKNRETACRAKADDPGLAGAFLEAFQPLPRGVDIVERRSQKNLCLVSIFGCPSRLGRYHLRAIKVH